MNRITTALLAALEALIVVAIGVGIALVPLTILWATHFGLAVDWAVFWRAAADVWLLGHGVDLSVQLDPAVVTALGLPATKSAFPITIALLGFGLLSVLLGVRTGMRAAETSHRQTGVIAAIVTCGVLSALIVLSAGADVVRPAQLQGVLLPTAVYAAGVLIGAELGRPRRGVAGAAVGTGPGAGPRASGSIRLRYAQLPAPVRLIAAAGLRGGAATTVTILGVSALAVTALVLVNYATIIGLYETVQAGVMGGITLTLVQLSLIPNLVIWASAWFVGPGIAVGLGTSVSPAGTALGQLPGLPILGALPQGTLALGFIGLLVPVLAGFFCAIGIRQRMPRAGSAALTTSEQLVTGLSMGVVAGIMLGLLAWWSAGAMGPGRLIEVGPNPLLVGLLAAVEVGIGACAGMLTSAKRSAATGGWRARFKRR